MCGCRGSVLSSGTIGAAMEAAIAGRKAIAISFPFFNGWGNWTEDQVQAAVRVAGAVSSDLWQHWSSSDGGSALLYNVNVPVSVSEGSHEVLFTQVDTAAQYERLYGACDSQSAVVQSGLNACPHWSCTYGLAPAGGHRIDRNTTHLHVHWMQRSIKTAASTSGDPRRCVSSRLSTRSRAAMLQQSRLGTCQ